MVVLGVWVTGEIQRGVTRNTAVATALYVDSVVSPLLPDIRDQRVLSPGARRALDEILSQGALGERIVAFKIWLQGDTVAYSNESTLIGRTFPQTNSLKSAWSGEVAAEFNKLDDDENATERKSDVPLLEIYSPIREPWSGKVVAVAEFYERAGDLAESLRVVRLKSWLIVAFVGLSMMSLLWGIVLRGSSLIQRQREALEKRVSDLSLLLSQNQHLRQRVQRASAQAVASNERFLRRISADLHDGPAQLLALASLRLSDAADRPGELEAIGGTLDEAMQEIRDICRGLTLPRIEQMDFSEVLRTAVKAHEGHTRTVVNADLPRNAPPLTNAQKICIFRFVQEGLSNAYRHAGGVGQHVSGSASGNTVFVSVTDEGSGFEPSSREGAGLGLAGLRERVESLGGEMKIATTSSGTRLSMSFQLGEEGAE